MITIIIRLWFLSPILASFFFFCLFLKRRLTSILNIRLQKPSPRRPGYSAENAIKYLPCAPGPPQRIRNKYVTVIQGDFMSNVWNTFSQAIFMLFHRSLLLFTHLEITVSLCKYVKIAYV